MQLKTHSSLLHKTLEHYRNKPLNDHDIDKLINSGKFVTQIDQISEKLWYSYLDLFDDSNLYQTPAYGKNSKGGKRLSHFVLKQDDKVVGLAQLRLFIIPFLNRGIAYILKGPVWRRKNETPNYNLLSQLLKDLQREFVGRRKLVLRISPNITEYHDLNYTSAFISNGFKKRGITRNKKTILINLLRSMDEIRSQLNRDWRRLLRKAEKNETLIIEEGNSKNLSIIQKFHEELIKRKNFHTDLSIDFFAKIQESLPPKYKLIILLCKNIEGEYLSGLVGASIGDTGLFLIGATSERGMRTIKGLTHLLVWRMLEQMQKVGCYWADLGGINPEKNPEVYKFKSKLNGIETQFLDHFESSKFGISWFLCIILRKIKNF